MHRHDWKENFRRTIIKILDAIFRPLGRPMTALTGENQYSLTFKLDEEAVEEVFHDTSLIRNLPAYLKRTRDGRWSEGSWVLLYENAPDDANPWDVEAFKPPEGTDSEDEQIHVTIYRSRDNDDWVEAYAHAEVDWRDDSEGHLDEDSFRSAAKMFRWYIDQVTDLEREEHYFVR